MGEIRILSTDQLNLYEKSSQELNKHKRLGKLKGKIERENRLLRDGKAEKTFSKGWGKWKKTHALENRRADQLREGQKDTRKKKTWAFLPEGSPNTQLAGGQLKVSKDHGT